MELAGAVAKIPDRHASLVEYAHEQVVHRRILRIPEVTATLDLATATAYQNDGQVVMGMRIRVAETAAVDDHGMIEQVSVAIGSRFQLLQQVGERLHQMGVDLGDVIDL